MLFNSYEFLFLFLPCVFLVHRYLINQRAPLQIVLGWLCVASLFFYSWWKPEYLILLGSSLGINFLSAQALKHLSQARLRKLALTSAIVFNLSLLAYFKYTGFILQNLQALSLWQDPIPHVLLPLAISFFTFQQIAYLVTCYRNPDATCSLLEHVFFITFFPHLIAGPIVYKNELIDQVRAGKLAMAMPSHWQQGLSLFIIGLSKKLLIGDNLASLVNPLYEQGGPAGSFDAWLGSFFFGFQIYFDFSAYSDMALGIAYLFGLTLPINFDSPYKSVTYREFWRRWHVTLFRFFRDHVYIPLSRHNQSETRKIMLALLVFFLSGLWHGAAWTFVAWGIINWLLVILNDAWLLIWLRTGMNTPAWINHLAGRLYVFVAMSLTFMLFRSPDFSTALNFLQHLFSPANISQSQILAAWKSTQWNVLIPLPDMALASSMLLVAILLLLVVWHCPGAVRYSLFREYPGEHQQLSLKASTAVLLGILAWMSVMAIPHSSQFLYFQF